MPRSVSLESRISQNSLYVMSSSDISLFISQLSYLPIVRVMNESLDVYSSESVLAAKERILHVVTSPFVEVIEARQP